jgi:hypothetical protein
VRCSTAENARDCGAGLRQRVLLKTMMKEQGQADGTEIASMHTVAVEDAGDTVAAAAARGTSHGKPLSNRVGKVEDCNEDSDSGIEEAFGCARGHHIGSREREGLRVGTAGEVGRCRSVPKAGTSIGTILLAIRKRQCHSQRKLSLSWESAALESDCMCLRLLPRQCQTTWYEGRQLIQK